MNPTLVLGTRVVIFALTAYTIAIFLQQRKHRITNSVLIFLASGIIFDITATTMMILGSSNSPFTIHGFLGYTGLLGMLIDTILCWKFRISKGHATATTHALDLYSRIAYFWWVVVFITGGLLIVLK